MPQKYFTQRNALSNVLAHTIRCHKKYPNANTWKCQEYNLPQLQSNLINYAIKRSFYCMISSDEGGGDIIKDKKKTFCYHANTKYRLNSL